MERCSPWSEDLLELMRPRHNGAQSAKTRPHKAKHKPRCILDVERYRPADRKFALGVLALASCPRSPAAARRYIDMFLETRRALKKSKPRGISVGSR